jgi:hypothetical protein
MRTNSSLLFRAPFNFHTVVNTGGIQRSLFRSFLKVAPVFGIVQEDRVLDLTDRFAPPVTSLNWLLSAGLIGEAARIAQSEIGAVALDESCWSK